MAEPHTQGMVALVPTVEDADRLAVDGGLPAEELHLTMLFLGEASDWDDDARQDLLDAMRTFADSGDVEGDAFSLNVFNPGDSDRETCIVLGVGGQPIAEFRQAVVDAAPTAHLPEQHAPWVAHTSLIYTDDLSVLAELVDRIGPITYDRLRVAFADTVTDIPLSAQAVNTYGPEVAPVDKSRIKTARPLASLRDKPGYRITNMAGSGATEVYVYDEIAPWAINANEFVQELKAITGDKIDLHINSPGGDVFDAVAIYQALRNHPAEITVYVDSLAASSASFIAMAGDRRIIGPHGTMMIHDAWGFAMGNAKDMAKMAEDLDRVSSNIASIYASRAGGNLDAWREAMHAETWYSAQEAVDAGLMNEVLTEEPVDSKATKAQNSWDLNVFRYAGRSKAPAPLNIAAVEVPVEAPAEASETAVEPPTKLPAAEPEPEITEPKEVDLVSDLSEVRSRLGLDDTADETAILAALDALKAQADTPVSDPAVEAEVEAAKAENADLRKEVEKLGETVETMSAKLAATEADNAAKLKASVLDEAQRLGKFKPANRQQWEADYDEAPGVTTRLLARIEPGTEVPVNVVGAAGSPEPLDDMSNFEAEMARLDGPVARKVS